MTNSSRTAADTRPLWGPLLALLLAASALPCLAQGVESTVAQQLFEEGRTLVAAGKHQEACGKFEESQRLEPATGTLLNLALCNEQRGRTASAWLNYHDALTRMARENDPRQELARQRVAALEPLLPRLLVDVAERPAGLWVTLDGVALGPAGWGVNLPVDPGPHTLRAGAPGRSSVELELAAPAAGAVHRVAVPVLAASAPVAPAPAPAAAARLDEPPPAQPVSSWRRSLGGAAAGIGAVALAGAIYASLEARDAWDERNRRCRAEGGCDEAAVSASQRSERFAHVADAGYALAAAGAAASLTLFLLDRKQRARVGAAVSPRAALLGLHASF
jgi:hypothetical protein